MALCVGIKPLKEPDINTVTKHHKSIARLDNFDIQGGYLVPRKYHDLLLNGNSSEATRPLVATWGKSPLLSMPKLDNAGVDTKELRSLFSGDGSDAIIAAKLIQMLDSDDFDSLAQYSRCVASIAEEFGL